MSLADELLADLGDNEDEEMQLLEQQQQQQQQAGISSGAGPSTSNNNHGVGMEIDGENSMSSLKSLDLGLYDSVRSVAKLRDSSELERLMTELNNRVEERELQRKDQIHGPVESHPEYKLIVDANNMAVEITNEINVIHKFVRDKYSKRFPELESLIPMPLEYLMAVKELQNDLDKVKNNERLAEFLTQATIMVVSVTASTTQGQTLPQNEMDSILEACDMAMELSQFRGQIYQFVESRMSFIAPNLSIIVGAAIAAKLMGLAGGLTRLSKMPACNIDVLGAEKRTLAGFSSHAVMPHTGLIFHSEIVQETPADLRRKAARLVANKVAIAARVDASHAAPDGAIGQMYREKIEKALDKLQEPPPVKQVKPLPQPIDEPKKKRAGKRVRRMKERLAMTELRKAANRVTFGDIEDDAYQEDLGFSTGSLGKSGHGRLRIPQVDEKTKVRISKTLQKNLQKQHQTLGGTTTIKKAVAGTASSIAFTPVQGLEIVNPQAAEQRVNEANAKYFSSTSGFLSVIKKPT